MKRRHTYTVNAVGCYADGCHGHMHARAVLVAELCKTYIGLDASLIGALRGPMSDDAWEENEALELLNEACEPGVYFEFFEGELILRSVDGE